MRNCPDCSLTSFLTKEDLRYHRRNEHGFVKCDCSREFLETEYMEQHRAMSKVHIPGYYTGRYKCAECIKRFPKEHQLLQHQNSLCHKGKIIVEASEDRAVSSTPDLYMLGSSEIDSFIANHVQADYLFLDCCGVVINTLVRKLQEIKNFSERLQPRRIIKSGSMGKGTAVKNRADIDLVLMLNEYTDVDQLMLDMHDLLEDLKRYLLINTEATHPKKTRYSVQVETTCPIGHKHDVDILPAVDLLGRGLFPNDVFRKMKGVSKDVIHEYSVTLAPLQLQIISALPTKVKNVIKVMKYWKDKKLKEKNEYEPSSFAEKQFEKPNWPSSYALELVVINAWNEGGNRDGFDTAQALYTVLMSLVDHERFKVILRKQIEYSMDLIGMRLD